MLTNHQFIYFAPGPWDGLWRNRQQLMSIFARRNKVLFVERRLSVRSAVQQMKQGRLTLATLRQPGLRQISENLFVFRYPVWAPLSGRSPLKQFTRASRKRTLLQATEKLGLSDPIVWFSRPEMVTELEELPAPRLRIYHVVDEYAAYAGMSPAEQERNQILEREMLRRADLVIVVSPKLYETKRPYNPHTYLVPNAVNFDAYTAALANARLPSDLEAIPEPRLGYIGLIGDKLDFEALIQLAQEPSPWHLVFIGELRVVEEAERWDCLRRFPNVHYLGQVEAARVPDYVKGFQVGLMPYKLNQHAENISPLKLYEYLAAGLPVVSPDILAAREFGPSITLASNPQTFGQSVKLALLEQRPHQQRLRRQLAAGHTWEARAEQLSELIQARLAAKIF
jgi:glycosyltransferase involved in cell wall biosynthesis